MEKLVYALMEERGMSLMELTARLGYQSKTSLVRVMKNQVSWRALDNFSKRLNENLNLTETEQHRLLEVMEQLRWQDDYDSSVEMLRLLRGEPEENDEIWLDEVFTGEKMRLEDRYAHASQIRITMLNCPYVPVFNLLLKLVREQNASVEHFMLMREDSARVIRALRMLIPLIFEKNYAGYSYRSSGFGRIFGAQGVLAGDLMAVQYRSAAGELLEDMVVFDRAGHGLVQTAPQTGSFQQMLGIRREEFTPVKRTYFQTSRPEDYIQFCEEYAHLEHNRSLLRIKPDVSLGCVPEDILVNSLMEGSAMQLPRAEELLNAFRKVHRERVRNNYEKRRVTQTVLKRSAMVRFARTGYLSDHVWAMRPFTKEERVRILTLLLEHEENNPYFNIYFPKETDLLSDTEIAYYDGVGVMVTNANTDYALEGNHSEVLLVHDGFTRMFREYFERSLLTEQVASHAETVAFMNEMIRIAMGDE